MIISIERDIYEEIVAHLASVLPMEGCGLLGGVDGRISSHYPIDNRLNSPVAFEMAPEQLVSAVLDLEQRGFTLLAMYHSHPNGPASPSPRDIAQANYPETAQIIVSFSDPSAPQMNGFEIVEGRVTPISLNIV